MKPNKKLELLRWINQREIVRTHEIMSWGIDNFYNNADRVKREFVSNGLLRAMSKFEKECQDISTKEGCYKVNHKEIESYLQPSLF